MRTKVIDPQMEIQNIIDEIKHYFADNGHRDTKAIIGISGGKDSTIAAALLVRALGADRVIGVMMPEGTQKDIEDSLNVCELLGIKSYKLDILGTTEALYKALIPVRINCSNGNIPSNVSTNAPARIRMTMLYAVAALEGGRVINTGNASELYVGYTTKYGDLAGDYAILKNYYVRDILAIGDALEELPTELVHKAPGDGMSGKTDEDNMGFSYEVLDAYLLDDITPDYETLRNIEERHKRNRHKRDILLNAPRVVSRHWNDEPNKRIEEPFDF